jgi:tRNA pseudouridine55 synthase
VVETPQREIEVLRADLIESGDERATYEIECSSGTYVRVLIESLADAYCESLRRVAIGPFRIEDVDKELTASEALQFLPELRLDREQAEAVSHGRAIGGLDTPLHDEDPIDQCIRLTFNGELVAVARAAGQELRPEVVLT